MDTEALYKLLEERRRDLGLSQAEVSERAFGRPDSSAFQGIRRGSSPSVDRLAELCRALGLELYIGEPRRPGAPLDDADTAFLDRFDHHVSAGGGSTTVAEPIEPVPFSAKWLRRHNLRPSELSLLEVKGDSQEPILFDGDPIMVDKRASRPKSGELYVVVRPESVQVKWVTVLRQAFQLVSENPAYPPERVELHEAPEFFRVRWFAHFVR